MERFLEITAKILATFLFLTYLGYLYPTYPLLVILIFAVITGGIIGVIIGKRESRSKD